MESAFIDELDVGSALRPFDREAGFARWNRYAAVNDEFVPIHMDDEAGREAGYAGAIGMGNLHVAQLHCMLRQWLGGCGRIVEVAVEFRGPALRGARHRAAGVVTGVHPLDDGALVRADIWVEDEQGTRLTPGTAVVELSGGWGGGAAHA